MSALGRFWSTFNKPRGPFAKLAMSRIQRRARDLMSLASVLAFGVVMVWMTIALGLWESSRVRPGETFSGQSVLEHWHMIPNQPFDMHMLALACLLAFVASVAPLVCLRRLGKALYTQPPLSFIVARRFLWLGHALVGNIVIGFVAGLIVETQMKEYQITFSLGFWGTAIAAILAYVVAEMVSEGARAAEENREFV